MATIQSLAESMYQAFEQKSRDNGDKFWSLKNGSPEWMTNVIHQAHGDMMPDDWRYSIIRDCLVSIGDAGDDASADDMRDQATEWADSDVDVYNTTLANWLASHSHRGCYTDDAIEEFGFDAKRGIFGAIAIGQMLERQEVYNTLIDELEKLADTE